MRNQAGYTLLEVLIVLVITTALFFGGFATYREFSRRQILNATYKELGTNLSLAREFAMSGEKPSGCTGILSGYSVSFTGTGYTIAAVCSSTVTVRSLTLPSGVTISGPNFTYKVIGQGTNLTSGSTVAISYAVIGKTLNATLTQNGILQK